MCSELFKTYLVLELKVWVQVDHGVVGHGWLGWTEAPLSHEVLERQPLELRILDLLEFCSWAVYFEPLEFSNIRMDATTDFTVEDTTDICDVLDDSWRTDRVKQEERQDEGAQEPSPLLYASRQWARPSSVKVNA